MVWSILDWAYGISIAVTHFRERYLMGRRVYGGFVGWRSVKVNVRLDRTWNCITGIFVFVFVCGFDVVMFQQSQWMQDWVDTRFTFY